MQLPVTVELKGLRVLTSKQLAECYGTKTDVIKINFSRNRSRFVEGKHYIALTGDELKGFKNQVTKCNLVANRASCLYLWTEKGALLHAKSLNTDKAWEVYDYLVDFYFRAKEKPLEMKQKEIPKKNVSRRIKVSEEAGLCRAIQKVRDDLTCMNVLLQDCEHAEWESTYKSHRDAALDVISVITKDFLALMDLEPTVLEEKYW